MIPLTKGEKPQILADNEDEWTDEYVALRLSGQKNSAIESRHRHPIIKKAVEDETHDKCLYCEFKIGSNQFGDVEHILPKSLYPELYIRWHNLSLCCSICNNNKGNQIGCINPYTDEPREHVKFIGPIVTDVGDSELGMTTIRLLDLNREKLVLRRTQILKVLIDKIELHRSSTEPFRSAYAREIMQMCEPSSEFSQLVADFLKVKNWVG